MPVYKVYQHVTQPGEPVSYCNTVEDDSGYGPWLFCSHLHPTKKEAEICQDLTTR